MAFNGSLISFYNSTTGGWDNFPLSYVFKESYRIYPHRRIDMDSGANANGVLVRNVLEHEASTIEFSTRPMWNDSLGTMMAFIRGHYTIEKEKKLKIKYYAPDLDGYSTGDFYIPDIEFPIDRIDTNKNKIFYNRFTLKFIEY